MITTYSCDNIKTKKVIQTETLKKLRVEKGWSQQYVASQLKITQQAYANYESGKREPDNNTLVKLGEIFDVSVDYLLGRPEDASQKSNIQVTDENNCPIVLDEDALELIDSLRSRPEMKMLFSVSKKATAEDIIKAVKIIEALKDESES